MTKNSMAVRPVFSGSMKMPPKSVLLPVDVVVVAERRADRAPGLGSSNSNPA